MTVGIVIFLFFFKTFYLNYKSDGFGVVMDAISDDLVKANDMDEVYQEIFDTYIKKGLVAQMIWIFIPIVQTCIFPVHAGLTMFFNLINEVPQPRVMVLEMDILMVRSKQMESPWFEIVWFYTILGGFVLFPNFIGFDGSYCISVNHLCLKLRVLTEKLRRAFAETTTDEQLEKRVKEVIKEHQASLVYYNLLQDVFGGWMFVVFFITSLEITFNLYQLSLGGMDPKYLIFAFSTVVHNFVPCYFCTRLIEHGDDFCEALYMMPWEARHCQSVTRALAFMIARTQGPLFLTGMGMVTFNMELFVSSMTLMTSRSTERLRGRTVDSKSVSAADPAPLPPRGGGATSSSLHLRSRTTNDRAPLAGERFYIQVDFALPNWYN
ncbi:hypothetical protein JYU34_007704 [Plutella xylostella]|uniref:Odorant receptor n=1 Tax=Plutella xylostella TaxID=51655 RepID=A0ABQ7QR35_PLUXY|nr:hypothetical protein JYU34_007704 [Plutella xylostella]